jgi:hypothetical protein
MGHHRGSSTDYLDVEHLPVSAGRGLLSKNLAQLRRLASGDLGAPASGVPTVILGDLAAKDPAELIANLASQRISRIV